MARKWATDAEAHDWCAVAVAGTAGRIGGAMILGGFACLLHGIFPFLFVTTGSETIKTLSETCAARRALMAKAATSAPEARVSRA